MPKQLFILIGPKGSGKTHIGTLLERAKGIHFLRVEPLWIKWGKETGLTGGDLEKVGYEATGLEIDRLFKAKDRISFETLGVSSYFSPLLASLKSKYSVKLIKVACPPPTCLQRVKTRSSQDHIPVSDERVLEYNALAEKVAWTRF